MNTYELKVGAKTRGIEKKAYSSLSYAIPLTFTLLLFSMLLIFPSASKNAVKNSLMLCAFTLIPSLFPFMVLGNVLFSLTSESVLLRIIGRPFSRLFNVSEQGTAAFILGAVCGLPLGGKYALMLYKNAVISKDECERLMGVSTNAGMGFVVMGIGYSLWGSSAFGWCLYLCQIFASVLAGVILSKSEGDINFFPSSAPAIAKTEKKSMSEVITDAISDSSLSMLKICAFTVFFAVLSSFISIWCELLVLPKLFSCTVLSFTELTCACESLRAFSLSGSVHAENSAKILTFFSVGFCGTSAHFQLTSFASGTGISMRKYYITKLLSGIICAFTGAMVMLIFNV